MIPSAKRAQRRAYFQKAAAWGYSPGMYTREERHRFARVRAKRDGARAMRRRQRLRSRR